MGYVAELGDVTQELGCVSGFAKILRDRVRQGGGAVREDVFDAQSFSDVARDFPRLPSSTKLLAFIDDATVLGLAALGLTGGIALGLGILEFLPSSCTLS